MSRDLYNFIWVPGHKANTLHIGAHTDRVEATVHKPKDAVILYPSLFTPAVYVTGRATPLVELLIASKEELSVRDVNVHLKISAGLDPEKAYDPRPLFISPEGLIVVEKTKANDDGILHTHRRFSGILAKQVEPLYEAYKHIYKVSVADSALKRERPEVMEKLSSRMTVGELENAIVGQEPQDVSIGKFLKDAGEQGGAATGMPGVRLYAFKIASDDTVNLAEANPEEPVQCYHPLFVWSAEHAVANFGHVSDIHVNARHNLLRRSSASVVEDPANRSREVGTLLVDTNDSFASVLGQMRQDPTVHALAVGGDLIDHIRNAYDRAVLAPREGAKPGIAEIWAAVDLGDETRDARHPAGVDFLIFYSMMVDFCRRSAKPLFGISGNHDAYEQPFGISPRAFGQRANAGIPSDLNLTFYEALLAFGPTWAAVVKSDNFNDDWLVWFYRVFGAFNDFAVRLPEQTVVGLGWGSQEDLLLDEQGASHLPRSDDAISDSQLALLKLALSNNVVLFTHFTFVSFDETIPMKTGPARPTTAVLSKSLDEFNLGTFEKNREPMMEILTESTLRLIISGHSHRRGAYQITGASGDHGLAVTFHDSKTVGSSVSTFRTPLIVVSDSAGPMPRLNVVNEFGKWGSDVAGGTLATFSSGSSLQSLGVVAAARPKPRAAVALDYLDVDQSQVFSDAIHTEWVKVADEQAAINASTPVELYVLLLPLMQPFLDNARLTLGRVVLHGAVKRRDDSDHEWLRMELTKLDATGRRWRVPAEHTKGFHRWATAGLETFIGLTFTSSDAVLQSQYNWEDPWYFEVVNKSGRQGRSQARFSSERPSRESSGAFGWDSRFQEVPDFDWRTKNLAAYGAVTPGGE